jgi:ABC-type transport system involved in multi-copper enzyme maturation permease subunit
MSLFWHDLRRLSRRGHPVLGRIVIGLSLLIALAMGFVKSFPNAHLSDLSTTFIGDRRQVTGFGQQFVQVISYLQLIAVVAVTPVVCGGALAAERARGTLDLLRLSQASPARIIMGKFAARVLYLASFLAFCLPIFAFSQLWGDFEPGLIAGSFFVNTLTLAAVAAISLLCSAATTSAPAGVAVTYGGVMLLWALVWFMPWTNPVAIFADWHGGGAFSYLGSVLGCAFFCVPLTAACLFAASARLARDGDEPKRGFVPMSGSRAAPPADLDASLLMPIDARPFAFLFQPILNFLPQASSMRMFRPPRVRDHPMCWKELYFGGNPAAGELLRTVSLGVIIIEAVVGTFLLVSLMQHVEVPKTVVREWNAILRPIALSALAAAMLGGAVFAAGSITQERERKTLDALLALPHGRTGVLRAKWLGSLLRVRWPIAVVVLTLAVGLAVGAFHGLTVVTLVLAQVMHLAFAASLGIFCSVVFMSTGRSMLTAVLVVLATGMVPLLSGNRFPEILSGSAIHRGFGVMSVGLSPLATWQTLLLPSAAASPGSAAAQVLPGLVLYAGGTAILAGLAGWVFARNGR